MMEYTTHLKSTLMEDLYNLKGVVRVDTHTRTTTLGKWHLTVDHVHYATLCDSIDAILQTTFEQFPDEVKQVGRYKDFPHPCRLGKLA